VPGPSERSCTTTSIYPTSYCRHVRNLQRDFQRSPALSPYAFRGTFIDAIALKSTRADSAYLVTSLGKVGYTIREAKLPKPSWETHPRLGSGRCLTAIDGSVSVGGRADKRSQVLRSHSSRLSHRCHYYSTHFSWTGPNDWQQLQRGQRTKHLGEIHSLVAREPQK